jgi:hypothetical protein
VQELTSHSIGLAFGLGNAFSADAMTREVYKAEKDKIEAQVKAEARLATAKEKAAGAKKS